MIPLERERKYAVIKFRRAPAVIIAIEDSRRSSITDVCERLKSHVKEGGAMM